MLLRYIHFVMRSMQMQNISLFLIHINKSDIHTHKNWQQKWMPNYLPVHCAMKSNKTTLQKEASKEI